MSKEFLTNRELESKLNNTSEISQFEVTDSFFLIHMKNGDTIEVASRDGLTPISVVNYKYED